MHAWLLPRPFRMWAFAAPVYRAFSPAALAKPSHPRLRQSPLRTACHQNRCAFEWASVEAGFVGDAQQRDNYSAPALQPLALRAWAR
jgi:hypothetical protein